MNTTLELRAGRKIIRIGHVIGTAPQTTLFNKFSDTRIFAKNGYIMVYQEIVSATKGKCDFGGKLQIDAENLNFNFFESAL